MDDCGRHQADSCVISGGRHIATLPAGHALTEPKSARQFIEIRDSLSRLDYPDLDKQHLANRWKRLIELVRDQPQRDREMRLLRKELAHILLDGNPPANETMADLMRRIGLKRYPNRAIVNSPESPESCAEFGLTEPAGERRSAKPQEKQERRWLTLMPADRATRSPAPRPACYVSGLPGTA